MNPEGYLTSSSLSSDDEYYSSDEYVASETSSSSEEEKERPPKRSRGPAKYRHCPVCGAEFTQMASLKKHTKTIHDIPWKVLGDHFPHQQKNCKFLLNLQDHQKTCLQKLGEAPELTPKMGDETALTILNDFLGNYKETTRQLYKRSILKFVQFLSSRDPHISLVNLLDSERSVILIPPELIEEYLETLEKGYPVINNIKSIMALESLILIRVAQSNHGMKEYHLSRVQDTRNILLQKLKATRKIHDKVAMVKRTTTLSSLEEDAFVKNPEEFLAMCLALLSSQFFKRLVKKRDSLHPQTLRDMSLYAALIDSQGQMGNVFREMKREEFAQYTLYDDGIMAISVKEPKTTAGNALVLIRSRRVQKLLLTHYLRETSSPYMFFTDKGLKLRDLRAPINILQKHLIELKIIDETDKRLKNLSPNVIRKAYASIAARDPVLRRNMPFLVKTGKKQLPDPNHERSRIIYKRFLHILKNGTDTIDLTSEEKALLQGVSSRKIKQIKQPKKRKLPPVTSNEVEMLRKIFMSDGNPSVTDELKENARAIPAYREFEKKYNMLGSRPLTKKIRFILLYQI